MRSKTDSSNRAARLRLALCMAREAEAIGARMRELREEMGLTQRELAKLLPGKTEGKDISRWENAKHRPGTDTLDHIAEVLGTTVADLHAGPVADREPQGPTPDPFARPDPTLAALKRIEERLSELEAGQAEMARRRKPKSGKTNTTP